MFKYQFLYESGNWFRALRLCSLQFTFISPSLASIRQHFVSTSIERNFPITVNDLRVSVAQGALRINPFVHSVNSKSCTYADTDMEEARKTWPI
jgi:hypothetical protein